MLYCEVPLTIEDILYSLGAAVCEKAAASIDTYFIVEVIRTAYPESVKTIFINSNITYLAMPEVELLELRKIDSKMLGQILFNKGTLDSSYEVIESIYKYQFKLNNTEFDDSLFLVFGDQKTSLLVGSMQAEQVDTSAVYDGKD